MNTSDLQAQLGRFRKPAMVAGVVGLAVWLLGGVLGLASGEGGMFSLHRFFAAYVVAFLFWFGVTAGSLSLLMVHHVTGGGWGFIIRRQLEAGTRLLPIMAIAFLPIAITVLMGNQSLYWWARPENANDHILSSGQGKYLNVPFFLIRWVIYFVALGAMSRVLNKGSFEQDQRKDDSVYERLTNFSAVGLLLYTLLMTFAIVDLLMSLTPHWFSSIIGLLFVAAQGLSTFAVMHAIVSRLGRNTEALKAVPSGYFRDLGNLTLAFVLLWAYGSFSQFLIYYSGNTAESAGWYVQRMSGGWQYVGTILIVAHFFFPLTVLITNSGMKRNPHRLARIGFYLILMRFIDLTWWVAPTFHSSLANFLPSIWIYIGAFVGLGGVWLSLWSAQMMNHLKDRPLLPAFDPRLGREWTFEREQLGAKDSSTPTSTNTTDTTTNNPTSGKVQHG